MLYIEQAARATAASYDPVAAFFHKHMPVERRRFGRRHRQLWLVQVVRARNIGTGSGGNRECQSRKSDTVINILMQDLVPLLGARYFYCDRPELRSLPMVSPSARPVTGRLFSC